MTAHTYRSSKPTEELGSGASASPTAAFVASPSSPDGLDQRLQSTSEAPTGRDADAMRELRYLKRKLQMIVSHATGGSDQDHNAPLNDICVRISQHNNRIWKAAQEAALRTQTAPDVVAALNHYADQLCEGWCEQSPDCAHFEDCGGCLARRVAYQATGEV